MKYSKAPSHWIHTLSCVLDNWVGVQNCRRTTVISEYCLCETHGLPSCSFRPPTSRIAPSCFFKRFQCFFGWSVWIPFVSAHNTNAIHCNSKNILNNDLSFSDFILSTIHRISTVIKSLALGFQLVFRSQCCRWFYSLTTFRFTFCRRLHENSTHTKLRSKAKIDDDRLAVVYYLIIRSAIDHRSAVANDPHSKFQLNVGILRCV